MAGEQTALIRAGDVAAALGLLTRLPVPGVTGADRGARAAWAWPLAGLAVAALAAVPGALALAAGLPPSVAAGLVLGSGVVLTGALHEDGLADVCDGVWGGATPTRRLEIMRDSRIGSYGVLALILSLGLRWAALAALMHQGGWLGAVLGAAMLSRAAMAVVMSRLPPARTDGLSRHVGRPPAATAALAAGLALALAVVAAGPVALGAGLAVAALAAAAAALARARIGGQTGDVLGAVQQVGEIGALLVFAGLA